jgi:hypothetical protein
MLNEIYQNLKQLNEEIDKKFEVTQKDRELAKTYTSYKILNYLKDHRKCIGTIIIILMVWYYYCYLLSGNTHKIIQSGGGKFGQGINEGFGSGSGIAKYTAGVKARADASWSKATGKSIGKGVRSAGKAVADAPGKAKAYADRKVDTFKAMSGQIYQVLFQLALTVMMFLVFGPALAVGFAMIVCYSLLQKKIMIVKEL